MWQWIFSQDSLTQWTILALGVVAATFAGRKGGRLAVVGVFSAVWVVLFSLAVVGVRHLFELNPIGRVVSGELPMPTIAACVTALPALWTAGRASVRKSVAWGISAATFVTFVLPPVWLFATQFVPAGHHPCILPSLESSLPSRTITGIPTTGFFTDTCPTPVARELELDREYGIVRMHLWGSPHRLGISGQTPDGNTLQFGVNRIDATGPQEVWGLPPDRYSKVVTFWQTYDPRPDTPRPEHTEEFSVTVFQRNGEPLEEIPLRYVPQACSCRYFDSL